MDTYEFEELLPLQTHDPNINTYISHHYSCMLKCYENELYSSAYSHLHLLYMSYVYVQLLRIATEKQNDFDLCWIGFPNQEKDFLRNPTSPFSFALLNEAPVFRFFRLINFGPEILGEISKPVKTRNDRMHAKGDLFCDNEKEFIEEIGEYSKLILKIDDSQQKFLADLYDNIVDGFDEDYEVTGDDIEINLHGQLSLTINQTNMLAKDRKDKLSQYINTG